MTSKAPTPPPDNLRRPSVPPRGPVLPKKVEKHEHHHVHTNVDEGRMDYQIEFTYAGSDDKFSVDPRDINMLSSFGSKCVVHYKGQEIMVDEGYHESRERLRKARVEIMDQRRVRERNAQLSHLDQIPESSKWSF